MTEDQKYAFDEFEGNLNYQLMCCMGQKETMMGDGGESECLFLFTTEAKAIFDRTKVEILAALSHSMAEIEKLSKEE